MTDAVDGATCSQVGRFADRGSWKSYSSLIIGDVDGDGLPDMVLLAAHTGKIAWEKCGYTIALAVLDIKRFSEKISIR